MKPSNIKHLYSRAAFGINPTILKRSIDKSRAEVVKELLEQDAGDVFKGENPPKFIDSENKLDRKSQRKKHKEFLFNQSRDWLKNMSSNHSFKDKLLLFWHDHFACSSNNSILVGLQQETLRKHALGNFKTLLNAITFDPLMLHFLNGKRNVKDDPNENFARELMELFTLGRDNYTERDIKEVARCFTGWKCDSNGFVTFKKNKHDSGTKTVLGKTGNWGSKDVLNIILKKQQTARFISDKFINYYLSQKVGQQFRKTMAEYLYNSGYEIKKYLSKLFNSDEFYKPEYMGTKFKSPIEFLAGLGLHLNMDWQNSQAVNFVMALFNQSLFFPPNIGGWPTDKEWINSSALLYRLSLPNQIMEGYIDLPELNDDFDMNNSVKAIFNKKIESLGSVNASEFQKFIKNSDNPFKSLCDLLLTNPPSRHLISLANRQNLFGFNFKKSLTIILSSPEYQLA